MGSTLASKPVLCPVPVGNSMGFSGVLFRKSYSLSVRGGNLTLSLVSESTESASSGLAPREASELMANPPVANDLVGMGSSALARAAAEEEEEEEEEKDASARSAVTSVHWMGMENCGSVTKGNKRPL